MSITYATLKNVTLKVVQELSASHGGEPMGSKQLQIQVGEHTMTLGSNIKAQSVIHWMLYDDNGPKEVELS